MSVIYAKLFSVSFVELHLSYVTFNTADMKATCLLHGILLLFSLHLFSHTRRSVSQITDMSIEQAIWLTGL